MNDDIVTRLRNWHDQRDSWQTLTEAANEIEGLRGDRDYWQKRYWSLFERVSKEISEVARDL